MVIQNQRRLTTKSDIQGSIAHRAVYDGFMATTSVETANVGKVFIIRSLRLEAKVLVVLGQVECVRSTKKSCRTYQVSHTTQWLYVRK